MADQWITSSVELGLLEATTVASYRGLLNKWLAPAIGTTPIDEVHHTQLEGIYGKMTRAGRSPATVQRCHALARKVLQEAWRQELIDGNTAGRARRPRVEQSDVRVPDPELLRRLLSGAAERHPVMAIAAWLAAATGMRRGELCALRWSAVDHDAKTITVSRSMAQVGGRLIDKTTKTRQERSVTVDDGTAALLWEWRARCEQAALDVDLVLREKAYVLSLVPGGGDPLAPMTLTQAWHRWVTTCEVDMRFHDLRHAHASLLLAAGRTLPEVSARLGHSSVTTTANIYAHALPGGDAGSAEAIGRILAPSE